jgi:hypothetical protein
VKATNVQSYSQLRPVERCLPDAGRIKIALFMPPNFNEKRTMFADITSAPFFPLVFPFIRRAPKFG